MYLDLIYLANKKPRIPIVDISKTWSYDLGLWLNMPVPSGNWEFKKEICAVNLNQKPSHINKEKKLSKEIDFLLKEDIRAYDDIIVKII